MIIVICKDKLNKQISKVNHLTLSVEKEKIGGDLVRVEQVENQCEMWGV